MPNTHVTYMAIPERDAGEHPWVCSDLGCQWARPRHEPRPLRCQACGFPMIKGGRHLTLVEAPPVPERRPIQTKTAP